eukprot:13009301-Alexandrium_andersonii.AAC.1
MREGRLTGVRNPSSALMERIGRLSRHHGGTAGDRPRPPSAPHARGLPPARVGAQCAQRAVPAPRLGPSSTAVTASSLP